MTKTWLTPPVGAQAADLGGHGAHDFVGVQAALHEHLAAALMDQLDALGGSGRLGGRRVDDLAIR